MEASDRTRIAIYYSIWATICAAMAWLVVALIHTWFFSYNPGRAAGIVAEEPGVDQCDHEPGHRSANGGPDRVVDGDARTIAGFHRTSNLAKSRRRFHERVEIGRAS